MDVGNAGQRVREILRVTTNFEAHYISRLLEIRAALRKMVETSLDKEKLYEKFLTAFNLRDEDPNKQQANLNEFMSGGYDYSLYDTVKINEIWREEQNLKLESKEPFQVAKG